MTSPSSSCLSEQADWRVGLELVTAVTAVTSHQASHMFSHSLSPIQWHTIVSANLAVRSQEAGCGMLILNSCGVGVILVRSCTYKGSWQRYYCSCTNMGTATVFLAILVSSRVVERADCFRIWLSRGRGGWVRERERDRGGGGGFYPLFPLIFSTFCNFASLVSSQ